MNIMNSIKKFLLSAGVLGVFALYAWHVQTDNGANIAIVANPTASTVLTASPTTTPVATGSSPPPTNSPTQIPTATPQGKYKDGNYTGSVADAFYGNIQVQVVISGGKITNVIFLQYPSDRSTSRMINAQADPMLTQEAIAAQSAQVSGVSGATASSGAFIQSLQNALQQAS